METEAAHPHHDFFLSPSPRHLAELRIDSPHSAVAFSAPGGAAAGRKRRCLLPAASHRKKMLLELHPFGSPPSPSPPSPPSSCRSPATAPPLLSRVGFPASEFSFPSAVAWNGGSGSWGGGGGGNIFAFVESTPTTPSPTGSSASAVSFLASPGQPTTPTGSTASGAFAFAFVTKPKQPTMPTGPTANGGFLFTASPEQPPTPTGSPAGGGLASLSTEPSLSPREYRGGRAVASLPSPKLARTGSTEIGGFAFFPSPGPDIVGHTGSPASPAFVFSASQTSAPPVLKSGGGTNKRSRRQLGVAAARRKSIRQWEGAQQLTAPPQKVAKTRALASGEASLSSIQSGSSVRPCCTFFTSPAKAGKQASSEASSRSSSPVGSRCTFVISPARPSSVERASKQEREVEVSSVAREVPAPTSPAACPSAEVVVRVTCTCGVQKEFSFDHCH